MKSGAYYTLPIVIQEAENGWTVKYEKSSNEYFTFLIESETGAIGTLMNGLESTIKKILREMKKES